MAKYNLDNYLDKDGLGFPLNFRRGNPNPLDNSSVWNSLAAAKNYAQTDPTAYVGQILSVVNYTAAETDDEGAIVTPSQSTVEVYYIKDEAGNLEPVGTSPVGDEGTITVAEDGTVSLYGIEGLELTREDENGESVNITYQPLYVNGKLTWVEPSATTVEGLATEIEGLKTRISALETAVGKAAEGENEATGLFKDIVDINAKIGESPVAEQISTAITNLDLENTYAAKEHDHVIDDITGLADAIADAKQAGTDANTALETYKGTNDVAVKKVADDLSAEIERATGVENGLDSRIETMEAFWAAAKADGDEGNVIDTLKEIQEYIASDESGASAMAASIKQNADDIDALEKLVGALPEGAASDNVVAYIQEVADGKVDAQDGYNLISDEDREKLANIAAGANVNVIDTVDEAQFAIENKHLTLLDIAMGKVTGLSDALAGKVDKVEGSRLLTEDEATKLEKLVLGENGEVSVSGKVAAGNVDGLDAWITARAATLEGLSENNLSDTLLAKLNGIAEGAQVNVIDTVSDEFTVTGKNLAVKEIAQSKITGLEDALAGKVDAEDGYRLISEAEHEKLSKIAEGAQVNVLEGIKIGETLLDIVDKVATIPVGAGLKASDEVTIAEDGTLGVGEVNVNKLVQNEDEYLVLNGGAAAI